MKRMRKFRTMLALLTALALTLSLTAAPAEDAAADGEIIGCVVDQFQLLAGVPRPSHHEEKISAFLFDWAKANGFDPVRDGVNNIMFDVPATEGLEELPMGILQGHMDMVVAVEDGKTFDALEDPITVIRNDEAGTLTADGTSLGADDGSGVAVMMAIALGKMAHGPLRILITVNEEDGMTGAFGLDPAWLDGAAFLINIDNETSDQVLVSTAAGDQVRATGELSFAEPAGSLAISVGISHLKGGHSGVEIDKGRLNGIVGLASFLKKLGEEGISFELASFTGGTAANAIPDRAQAVLVIRPEDREALEASAERFFSSLQAQYQGIEEEIRYSVTEAEALPKVVPGEVKDAAITFITQIIDGVYTMSADMEGLVESSSNLGVFVMDETGLSAVTYVRSSSAELQKEIVNSQRALTAQCGFKDEVIRTADAWAFDPDSRLLERVKEIYLAKNGEEIEVIALHAGLECGTFKALRPELDMVSIGPDISGAHTTEETLYLRSIPKIWHLLEGLLGE